MNQGQIAAGAAGEAGTRMLRPPACEPASLHRCTLTKKASPQKKKEVTRSTAGRPCTSSSRSIWRRPDTGRPGQLLWQTKIALLPAWARGRVRQQLPGPKATQGQERALCSLPAPACGQDGPSPPHSAPRARLRLNHTSAQLARGSGKPSACHRRVKTQQVIYLKYQQQCLGFWQLLALELKHLLDHQKRAFAL